MKRALTTLLTIPIILVSSFSVVSCDKNYHNFFNSIIKKIESENNVKVFSSNISPSINDGNTIFEIKNALNLSLDDMDYVNLMPISNTNLILNKTININFEVKVLDYQKIIQKQITWEKNINNDIQNYNINNMYTLLNKETYATTNHGLYLMNNENHFDFSKVITNLFDNYEIYNIYQKDNGNIYVGTNHGLYYSNNGIIFYKNNNIIGNVYQIINSYDGILYINLDHSIYYSNDNGINFSKINTNLIINNIVKYNNDIYLCTNKSLFLLNKININKIKSFEDLGNVKNIYWVNKNLAYIFSDSKLYYYNNIISDFDILIKKTKSVDNTLLGTPFSITKIKNVDDYLFLATSTGIFFMKINLGLINDFILKNISEQKIFSYFSYTLYNTSYFFKGLNPISVPIDIIFKGGN